MHEPVNAIVSPPEVGAFGVEKIEVDLCSETSSQQGCIDGKEGKEGQPELTCMFDMLATASLLFAWTPDAVV